MSPVRLFTTRKTDFFEWLEMPLPAFDLDLFEQPYQGDMDPVLTRAFGSTGDKLPIVLFGLF